MMPDAMRRYLSYIIVSGVVMTTAWTLYMNHDELLAYYVSVAGSSWLPVAGAMTAYLLLFQRSLSFYENFFHELTHMLFAMVFLENVKHFFASQTHGEVVTSSTRSNIVIITAPYHFPLNTLALQCILSLLPYSQLNIIVPVSYGIFLAIVIKQGYNQSQELRSFGWIGIPFVLVMSFWTSLIIFTWYSGDISFLKTLFNTMSYEHRPI